MIEKPVPSNSAFKDHVQRTLAQGVHGSPSPSESPTFTHIHVPVTEFTFEQGLWTPVDSSGAGLTLTITGTPRYIKMGKLVWVSAHITYPTTANASSNIVGGFPFAAENNWSVVVGGTIGAHSILEPATVRGIPNTATFQFRKTSTDNPFTNAELSGKYMGFALMYMIA